jgi:hypothetical protein
MHTAAEFIMDSFATEVHVLPAAGRRVPIALFDMFNVGSLLGLWNDIGKLIRLA